MNAPHVRVRDIARLLIGVMGTLNTPAVKAAQAVSNIGNLVGPEIRILAQPEQRPDAEIVLASAGTFLDALSCIIRRAFAPFDVVEDPDAPLHESLILSPTPGEAHLIVKNVLITLDGPTTNAWIEIPKRLVKPSTTNTSGRLSDEVRFMYGNPPEMPCGMVQEVRVRGLTLFWLLTLGPLPEQKMFEEWVTQPSEDKKMPQGLQRVCTALAQLAQYKGRPESLSSQQIKAIEQSFRNIQDKFGVRTQ